MKNSFNYMLRNTSITTLLFCLLLTTETKALECAKIAALSISAAVTYGILNDIICAHLCPEYFSEGFHKDMRDQWRGPILGTCKKMLETTQSPVVAALIWGTVATWWMGAILSIPTMLAARVGPLPQLAAADLIIPTAAGVACMSLAALAAGILGYQWALKTPLETSIEKRTWAFNISRGCFFNREHCHHDRDSLSHEIFKQPYDELNREQRAYVGSKMSFSTYIDEQKLNMYIAVGTAIKMAYSSAPLVAVGIIMYTLLKRLHLRHHTTCFTQA